VGVDQLSDLSKQFLGANRAEYASWNRYAVFDPVVLRKVTCLSLGNGFSLSSVARMGNS